MSELWLRSIWFALNYHLLFLSLGSQGWRARGHVAEEGTWTTDISGSSFKSQNRAAVRCRIHNNVSKGPNLAINVWDAGRYTCSINRSARAWCVYFSPAELHGSCHLTAVSNIPQPHHHMSTFTHTARPQTHCQTRLRVWYLKVTYCKSHWDVHSPQSH